MTDQPNNQPLASFEADLFGTLIAFHKKTVTRMARLNVNGNSETFCVNPRFPRLAGIYT